MTDFTKPIEYKANGGWISATVHRVFSDGFALISWGDDSFQTQVYPPDSGWIRNVPPAPVLEPFTMDNVLLSHWYRGSESSEVRRILSFDVTRVRLGGYGKVSYEMLAAHWLHSPTPRIADSWRPCGVERQVG